MQCTSQSDCPINAVCLQGQCVNKRLVKYTKDQAELDDGLLRSIKKKNKKKREKHIREKVFKGRQGSTTLGRDLKTFFANQFINKKNNINLECNNQNFTHQNILKEIIQSPGMTRMLVAHRVGSGKTRSMIAVLDSLYYDTRPKILTFPVETLVDNFYEELLTNDCYYKQYLETRLKNKIPTNKNSINKKLIKEVKDILAMKNELRYRGQPGYLFAPLRVYSYSGLGGGKVFNTDVQKLNADITKMPFSTTKPFNIKKPLDHKIILMDEYHNLFDLQHPQHQYIQKFRQALMHSTDSVIIGFTATPVIYPHLGASQVLRDIKGLEHEHSGSDGFVSFFYNLPTEIYPRTKYLNHRLDKCNNPSICLPQVVHINLAGENLIKYVTAVRQNPTKLTWDQETPLTSSQHKLLRKLQIYQNSSMYYTRHHYQNEWQTILKSPEWYMNKLYHIVIRTLKQPKKKTLILINKKNGLEILYKLFLHVMKERIPNDNDTKVILLLNKNEESHTLKNRFNDRKGNAYGEKYMIALANAQLYSEGVSFYNIRRLIIADIPENFGQYEQMIGRVYRACGYDVNKKEIEIELYCSVLPKLDQLHQTQNLLLSYTPDQLYLQNLHVQQQWYIEQLSLLYNYSVEKYLPEKVMMNPPFTGFNAKANRANPSLQIYMDPQAAPSHLSKNQWRSVCSKLLKKKSGSNWDKDTLKRQCSANPALLKYIGQYYGFRRHSL